MLVKMNLSARQAATPFQGPFAIESMAISKNQTFKIAPVDLMQTPYSLWLWDPIREFLLSWQKKTFSPIERRAFYFDRSINGTGTSPYTDYNYHTVTDPWI